MKMSVPEVMSFENETTATKALYDLDSAFAGGEVVLLARRAFVAQHGKHLQSVASSKFPVARGSEM